LRKASPHLGAEVLGSELAHLIEPPNVEALTELQRALDEHIVLLFRRQVLEPRHIEALGRHFGPLMNLKRQGGMGAHRLSPPRRLERRRGPRDVASRQYRRAAHRARTRPAITAAKESIMNRLTLSAALVAGALALAAPVAAVELRISGVGNPQTHHLFEELAKAFNAAGGPHTARYSAGAREMEDAVQQLLRDQLVGAALPDVYLYSGNATRLLAERGLAVPLDAMMTADADGMKRLSASVPAAGQFGGKTYAFGFGVSMPMVLFNSALVERAGGDPQNLPKDWNGIVALGKKIDALGRPVVGAAIEYDNGGAFSWLYMLQSQGGNLMDAAETKLTFDGPEGLAALDVLRQVGAAGQGKSDMTRDQLRQAFGAGSVGVLAGMSSLIPGYETQAAGRFKVLSVRFPTVPGSGRVPAAGPLGVILAKNEQAQKAGFAFLKFAAEAAGQIVVAKESGYEPINAVAVRESAALRDLMGKRSYAQALIDNLEVAVGWYALPGSNGTKAQRVFNDYLRDVVVGKTTPAAALAGMRKELEPLLAAN
jgi:multiple sugar transport system substrate-binding protein